MANPNASPFHGGLTGLSIALLVFGFAVSIDAFPIGGLDPIAIFAVSIFVFGLSFTTAFKEAGFKPVASIAYSAILGLLCVGLMLALVHLASMIDG